MAETLLQALTIACDKTNPNSDEAENALENASHENPVEFFTTMLEILKMDSVSDLNKRMAMILVTRLFPLNAESGNQNLALYPEEAISQYLAATFEWLKHPDDSFASISAGLYARIAIQDLQSMNLLSTIDSLIAALQDLASPHHLWAISRIFSDICEFSTLDEDESNQILQLVINIIKDGDIPYKEQALVILKTIIHFIDEVLTDEENSSVILQLMLEVLQTPQLKLNAYDCWIEIVECYYPLLEPIVEPLHAILLEDIESEDPNIVLKVVTFFESLANCENVKDDTMNIIGQIADTILPALFQLAASCPYPEISDETDYTIWTTAANVLQISVYACPEQAYPVLVQLASENMTSQEYGEREAALMVIGSIIESSNEKRNPSEIIPEAVDLINDLLEDDVPRVRYNAVLCLHTLLLNILERGDQCAFAPIIPTIAPHILEMSEKIIAMMEEDEDLQATVVLAAVDFLRFPGFPHSGAALANMYQLALHGDGVVSMNAFSALGTAIEKVSEELLKTVFAAILDLLQAAIDEGSDSYFVEQICYLLQKLFFRLAGQINDSVERCWTLLNAAYQLDQTISYSFILPIAALGRASSTELFQQYIEPTIQFVVAGLNEPNSQAVANAALSISLLSDKYDLTSILGEIIPPMIGALQSLELEDISKRYIIDAVSDLAKKIPIPFAEALNDLMPVIFNISESLSDYQEEISENSKDDFLYDTYESILISYLHCFKETINCAEAAQHPIRDAIGEASVDLLEVACGLDFHRENLLREIVLMIEFLMNKFPAEMKAFMENEPGFHECLMMAVKGRIELETIKKISEFFETDFTPVPDEEEEEDAD